MTHQRGFISIVVAITISLVAILMLIAAVAFEQQKQDAETTVVVSNINNSVALNKNTNTNTNATNATVTNQNSNTNINTNSTAVDTSDWLTYTNEEYGYTIKYPPDWTYKYINETTDPLEAFALPIRYVILYSSNQDFQLLLGIKKTGDKGSSSVRTGIGAGDFQRGEAINVGSTDMILWHLMYDNKSTEVFNYNPSQQPFLQLGKYELKVWFSCNSKDNIESIHRCDSVDLRTENAYSQMKQILGTLELK